MNKENQSMNKENQSMNKENLAEKIREKALDLGFDSCGIIKVDALRDYADKLKARLEQTPASKPMLEYAYKYAAPDTGYDWAKSIVVCVMRYGTYQVPEQLEGLIGKYYLFDYKLQEYSKEYAKLAEFEACLRDAGLKTARELHGVTAARWAAYKAGLGTIGKNNFFYSEQGGSWVIIETWLIDEELELIGTPKQAECPEGCSKCMDACPTAALSQPYCTDMSGCITWLTWGLKDLPPEELREKMGKWIYGCDACQNACPRNKNQWRAAEEYPRLDELTKIISLEKLLIMDDKTIEQMLMPRFWFIRKETAWLWKTNALRAMISCYKPEYEAYIRSACNDSNEKVRKMADWALSFIQ